jgi:hypothetical protein
LEPSVPVPRARHWARVESALPCWAESQTTTGWSMVEVSPQQGEPASTGGHDRLDRQVRRRRDGRPECAADISAMRARDGPARALLSGEPDAEEGQRGQVHQGQDHGVAEGEVAHPSTLDCYALRAVDPSAIIGLATVPVQGRSATWASLHGVPPPTPWAADHLVSFDTVLPPPPPYVRDEAVNSPSRHSDGTVYCTSGNYVPVSPQGGTNTSQ